MPRITRSDFIQNNRDVALPVQALAQAARLQGVKPANADANKDGVISGPAELSALWDQLCGKDAVETKATEKSWMPWSRLREVDTREGQRLQAVESFRVAALRTREAAAAGDSYLRTGELQGGPARGEPMDTERARPVARLDAAARAEACARAGIDPATIGEAFANFRHNGRFWISLVPKDAVKDVYVMLESFPAPVPAAHAMLRFALHDDKKAILVPQDKRAATEMLELPDLVFSAEALGQPGWRYDLVAGQTGSFGMVNRFESLEDRFHHVESYEPIHPVAQHRVNIDGHDKQAMLAEALRTSESKGLKDTYNTANNSCGTEAFAVLDRGIGNDVPPWVHAARFVTGERLPPLGELYLRMRGLLKEGEKSPSLHDEMAASARVATPRVRP